MKLTGQQNLLLKDLACNQGTHVATLAWWVSQLWGAHRGGVVWLGSHTTGFPHPVPGASCRLRRQVWVMATPAGQMSMRRSLAVGSLEAVWALQKHPRNPGAVWVAKTATPRWRRCCWGGKDSPLLEAPGVGFWKKRLWGKQEQGKKKGKVKRLQREKDVQWKPGACRGWEALGWSRSFCTGAGEKAAAGRQFVLWALPAHGWKALEPGAHTAGASQCHFKFPCSLSFCQGGDSSSGKRGD